MRKKMKMENWLKFIINFKDKIINEADDTKGHKLDFETEAA